jgi:hypothetical protein
MTAARQLGIFKVTLERFLEIWQGLVNRFALAPDLDFKRPTTHEGARQ